MLKDRTRDNPIVQPTSSEHGIISKALRASALRAVSTAGDIACGLVRRQTGPLLNMPNACMRPYKVPLCRLISCDADEKDELP